MEPLAFVMALLGCGEGDLPCTELRLASTRFESQAQCLAASETEIGRVSGAQFPVIVAQCRRVGEQAEAVQASEISLPEPEPNRHFPVSNR